MSLEGMLQNETRADGTLWITFGIEPEEITWTGTLNELTLAGDVRAGVMDRQAYFNQQIHRVSSNDIQHYCKHTETF